MHKRQWQEQLNFRFFNHRAEGQRRETSLHRQGRRPERLRGPKDVKEVERYECFEKPLGGCSLWRCRRSSAMVFSEDGYRGQIPKPHRKRPVAHARFPQGKTRQEAV